MSVKLSCLRKRNNFLHTSGRGRHGGRPRPYNV